MQLTPPNYSALSVKTFNFFQLVSGAYSNTIGVSI